MSAPEIDTSNEFLVGAQYIAGKRWIVFALKGVPQALSEEQALRLAAWLVALAADSEDEFLAILEAVLNT